MSQHLHKHYFPPLCILTDCWCCGLRTAVVVIACITSFVAAFTFIYYIYSLVFGVYATGTYITEYYLEKKFNTSMFKIYKSFNRSSATLCQIRRFLTSTTDSGEGQRRFLSLRRKLQPFAFDLADVPADLLKMFSLDEIAYLADTRLDYGSLAGRAQAKEFWRSYERARIAINPRAPPVLDYSKPAPSLYNFHFWFPPEKVKKRPKPSEGVQTEDDRKTSVCKTPYLLPRVNVDKKINDLRVILFGGYLYKMHKVSHVIGSVGLVTAVAAMAASALLIFGVLHDYPLFIVPWLVVVGFMAVFNLVIVDMKVTMWYKAQDAVTPATVPTIIVLSSLVAIASVLAMFVVASYLYLIYTTGFYLQRMPRTTQLVVSGSTQPSPEPPIEVKEEKPKR